MLNYQRLDAAISLREGLNEYHAAQPALKRGSDLSPDARHFFVCHDTVHVLYGCGISLEEEAVVKLASIFGTDAGWGVLRGYALYEARDIYRALKPDEIARTILKAPKLAARTWWNCRKQPRLWPWSNHAQLLDKPLYQLRLDFGIRFPASTHR